MWNSHIPANALRFLLRPIISEFKQQGRRRLRKRPLKRRFALLQTVSRLFHLIQFVNCWQTILDLNSKRLYQGSRKIKSFVLVNVLHKMRSLALSHRSRAVKAKKCTKKRDARAKLLFANLNLLGFFAVLVAVADVVASASYSLLWLNDLTHANRYLHWSGASFSFVISNLYFITRP